MFKALTYGLRFRIGEVEYEILKKRDQDFEVLNIQYDQKELLSLSELLTAYNEIDASKRLFLEPDTSIENAIEFDLRDYAPEEIDIMNKRYQVIEPFIVGKLKASEVRKYLEGYPDSLKPNQKLSVASFYRWVHLWLKREYKIDLIPKRRGPNSRRISEIEMTEISRIITKYGNQSETTAIKDQYTVLKSYLKDINDTRDEQERLKVPSESTFRRIQKEQVDTYDRDKEMLGTANANLKHFGSKTPERATRPLEVMELDWTPVDCLIVDFDLEESFRPVFMYGIDQATNEPMGFHLIMKKEPNAADWKQLLLHCILPKTNIKELYPKVQNEWTAYGIPQNILLDNARVNDSSEVEEVCGALGIGLRYAAAKHGNQKGKVEQALGNINHKAFQGLVGSLFSNVREKGEYNAESKATVSLNSLYHIAHIAIVDMVANNYNRGEAIRGVPEEIWKQGLREMKVHPKLAYKREYLELIFSTNSVTRVIVPRGIELMGHFFFSEELNNLRRRLEQEGRSRTVTVRFGSDMRVVYVRDDLNKKYVQAYIKDGGLLKNNIDKSYPIHAQLLLFLSGKDNSTFNEFENTHLGYARRAIEEIQAEDKRSYKREKSRKRSERAAIETVASAIHGVPSERISSISDNIIINNVSDYKGKSNVTDEELNPSKEKVVIDKPKPGELFVADIDLDEMARKWETSTKGG
ncbi:hypothetical protein [Paenibacillus sp. BJ-4]|uniref:hypothetical protein n=1 Tax=Paenibacillus sp. BJ-4 TaxID=2878097 RepID=UPI001CF0C838|nr:hypothetical protein [Paenibacillus sp. BJ-4]